MSGLARRRLSLPRCRFLAAFILLGATIMVLAPRDATAQVGGQYKVGDRVAANFGTGYLDSVIVRIDPRNAYPYRVHPFGFEDTMDSSFAASDLKPYGSVPTKPVPGATNDPKFLALQGKKPFQPTKVYPGAYECWTLSGGGAASLQPAMQLNFTILDDRRYRDVAGTTGSYRFDPATATLVFQGGTLNRQRARYEQIANPPTAAQPPKVTLLVSGDSCDRRMR
ncbi:MAG: hypothetical protein KGL11_02025 [Alphaproteobacteria bacterium]|nr:hypothetical protein [Alphaproteobacteria bacterium]